MKQYQGFSLTHGKVRAQIYLVEPGPPLAYDIQPDPLHSSASFALNTTVAAAVGVVAADAEPLILGPGDAVDEDVVFPRRAAGVVPPYRDVDLRVVVCKSQ